MHAPVPACFAGVISIGIELQAYVPLVLKPRHGRKHFREIDGAQARDEVVMRSVCSDVFNVHVSYPGKQLCKGSSRVFAGAEKVADVKIDPHVF